MKSILSRKNLRGGGELLLKNGTIDGLRLLTKLLPGPGLHCAGHLSLWGFLQHLACQI